MELFSSKAHLKRSSEPCVEESTGCSDPSLLDSSSSITDIDTSGPVDEEFARTAISNFEELGICQWLLQSTGAMGFRRPTPIQQACIPSILKGKDVMGCAETGSGKTAAFALPILQHLSEDPYGIFAVVLTPTRELAVQICEQFSSLGAPMGARVESIIGGMNMTEQSLKLARRPHVLVATPGRLRHHMLGADPPNLSKVRYVVLDEADRLLCDGFSSELDALLEAASHPKRQTLLFSATLSSSLQDLQRLATKETLRFDLTLKQRIPATLSQQLLFIPGRVKLAYLVAVLRRFLSLDSTAFGGKSDTGEDEELMSALAGSKRRTDSRDKKRKHKRSKKGQEAELEALLAKSSEMEGAESKSAMIFIGSCQRCAETVSTLTEMGVDCVALHSLLPQSKRLASLQRFRDSHSRVLVATDVASRGLDIPSVELVINYDLTRLPTDYVHRVGRAARAGRTGRSLSLVTPNDLNLVKAVEAHTGDRMQPSDEVTEDEVVAILNPVSKAMRVAQQRMLERGFEEQASTFLQRKKDQKKNLRRKREAVKTDTE